MRIPRHFLILAQLPIIISISFLCVTEEKCVAGTYLDSAHGGSNGTGTGVLRSSLAAAYAAGNCAHCHEEHASIGGNEPQPIKPGPSNYLLFDDMAGNTLCNYCHNGSTAGVDNIASQISKSRKHDPYSSKGTVLCNDCHDSHVAKNINHREAQDGNLVSGPILAVAGVSVSSWPAPGTPPNGSDANLAPGTPSLNGIDPITREYQLCFKCHGGQAAYSSLADLRGQFNPNNFAAHPVATETKLWKNNYLRTINPAALKAPWNANLNSQMYCSDCHGSDNSGDPVGPHGSANIYMLKLAGPGATLDNLCLKCHVDPASGSAWTDTWGTPIVGDHSLRQHQSTATNPLGTNNAYGCLACHGGIGGPLASNVHGANYIGNNNGGATTGRPSYAFLVSNQISKNYYITANGDTPGSRFCAASCHLSDGGIGYAY